LIDEACQKATLRLIALQREPWVVVTTRRLINSSMGLINCDLSWIKVRGKQTNGFSGINELGRRRTELFKHVKFI